MKYMVDNAGDLVEILDDWTEGPRSSTKRVADGVQRWFFTDQLQKPTRLLLQYYGMLTDIRCGDYISIPHSSLRGWWKDTNTKIARVVGKKNRDGQFLIKVCNVDGYPRKHISPGFLTLAEPKELASEGFVPNVTPSNPRYNKTHDRL